MPLILQAAIIGLIQGLTEFIPISSSAHLIFVPRIAGWNDPFINSNAFDVMLHMGTLVALLIYFWGDLVSLLLAWLASIRDRSIRGDPSRRLAWLLVISVIPGALLGAFGESFFDTFFREHSLLYIAALLAIGATILWIAEAVGRRRRELDDLRVRDAATIGAAQALALFPGISRSGITIAAGLFLGLEREAAARFSFLMATPIIAGAGIWKARELFGGALGAADVVPLVVGFVAAALAGLAAIAFLLAYLRRRSTALFIGYRYVAAALLVMAVVAGR
ncbi:MAG: undecaprenyl-diphosphatase UppP [Chloroflexota bacterium]|nr:undecaprenyl-diphosphatase UppP [Chloroflexota bacterium]